MTEANATCPLTSGRQEDLWRRRVAVLLEEMVLGHPDGVESEFVGKFYLFERLLESRVLRIFGPGSRENVLTEQ